MAYTDEFLETPENSNVEEVEHQEVAIPENLDDLSKEELAAALLKINETKDQFHARMIKAEAKLKEVKVEEKKGTDKPIKKEDISLEEQIDLRFLKRDGLTDEQIEDLKLIQAGKKAMGMNITLMEAMNDPLYKSAQQAKDLEEKRKKAQISSDGGSYSDYIKQVSGMSEEEHAAFAKQEADKVLNNL